MFVCLFVYIIVSMYVCMYVCMYAAVALNFQKTRSAYTCHSKNCVWPNKGFQNWEAAIRFSITPRKNCRTPY